MRLFYPKIFSIPAFIAILFAFAVNAVAQDSDTRGAGRSKSHDWLKVYTSEGDLNRINIFNTSEIDSIFFKAISSGLNGISNNFLTVATSDGSLSGYPLVSIDSVCLGGHIPTLYIETDPYVEEITDKETYLNATLRYEPYDDGTSPLEAAVSIKGRGNSSWNFLKKPYRLKFDKKQSLAGLHKAKSFVLLSNFIDNTLMRNAVAYKVAKMLGMPYTNSIVPVNVVFNGHPKGSYMLTNKVGINSGSVDIEEKDGILWELSTEFDEPYKFRSEPFNLPCMVKDPDFSELYGDNPSKLKEEWEYWQKDLNNAFKAVQEGRWQEVFDAESFVNYFLVQDIVQNTETEFPKSFYIYKENRKGKYHLGPVWDFDWALGYSQSIYRGVIFPKCGSWEFLSPIFDDPEFLRMFGEAFEDFCNEHLDELLEFIDSYAATIRDSALADAMLWPQEHMYPYYEHEERHAGRFDRNIENLKQWLLTRIDWIRTQENYSLYK